MPYRCDEGAVLSLLAYGCDKVTCLHLRYHDDDGLILHAYRYNKGQTCMQDLYRCSEDAVLVCFTGEMCYVVLHNGCLYVYKDERQMKPDKALSLFGYTQCVVSDVTNLRVYFASAFVCLQCFDTVGLASGRTSGL